MMSNLAKPLGGHEKNDFIQVWRGIAAFLVIYFHLSARVPSEYLGMDSGPSLIFYSGKVGVLIFFVISGYLIVQSLQYSRNLASFYAKRISRLWPLFALAAILIFLFIQFVEPPIVPSGPKKFFTDPPTVLDLAGNIFFLNDLGFRWVDGVFWSILVELKFYMWIGLLAALSPRNFVRYFALAAIALSSLEFVVSLSGAPALVLARQALNGMFVAHYLSFFAIGALLVTRRNPELLVLLIGIALVQTREEIVSDADFALAPTIVFVLALAALVTLDRILLRSRIFLTIGDYSYSWYLFHQMIGLSIIKLTSTWLGYDPALAIALMATFALSVAASWTAEWRFRDPVYRLLCALFGKLGLDRVGFGGRTAGSQASPAGQIS
jgi:peptidoglycan/LPS O-acetylase OafA/YrhL